MNLNVFHGLSMFSSSSFFKWETKNVAGSHVRTVKELGIHWGHTLAKVVNDDKSHMYFGGGVSSSYWYKLCTDLSHLQIIGHYPMYHNFWQFRVLTIYWIVKRWFEHKTSSTRFTLLSNLVIVGCSERGSSVISSRPSLNTLCHLPGYVLDKKPSLKVS